MMTLEETQKLADEAKRRANIVVQTPHGYYEQLTKAHAKLAELSEKPGHLHDADWREVLKIQAEIAILTRDAIAMMEVSVQPKSFKQ